MDSSISPSGQSSAQEVSQYAHLPPTDPLILTHIRKVYQERTLLSPIYAFLLPPSSLSIIHTSRGLFVARLLLSSNHMNSSGSIHGGVSATLVDWAGGTAIATWDTERNGTGVSVDINVTYLSGARVGEMVEIEGRADRVGGAVGFTSVGIWKVDEETGGRGQVVVLGRHTKFVGGGRKK